MTAPALSDAIRDALDDYRHACREDARRAARGLAPNGREEVTRAAVIAAIAAELAPRVAHDAACGLGEGTHFACDCTLRRLAELEAEVARLRNGLAIAESFVRTADAELKEARAVLEDVEWNGGGGPADYGFCVCPVCGERQPDPDAKHVENRGHAPGCRLAALLGSKP